MKITAHCLVKNEENFIWFAINSVVDFVDEIMVWDQGSNDKTMSIIQSINNSKIKVREVSGEVETMRQKMLEETDTDWIFILDGDEIWWEESIRSIVRVIKTEQRKIDAIVVPNYMLIGDTFHYQEEKAGRYNIAGRRGNLNIRAVRLTPGLYVHGDYGNEGYSNKNEIKVQDLPRQKLLFLEEKYLHASFLERSRKSKYKFKYEIGEEFPKDFYYPEVFFRPRPSIVPSPWKTMGLKYKLNAFWQTPLKKIKRRLITK